MKCKICGTNYQKGVCPNCKSKKSKSVRIIGICVFLIGALGAVLIIFFAGILKKDEKTVAKTESGHKLEMERFLENDDYEALYNYIDDNSLYSTDYSKYREVYDVYAEYKALETSLKWLKEIDEGIAIASVEGKKENVYLALYSACTVLYEAHEHIFDVTPQQNEGDLQKIYEWTVEKVGIFGFDTDFCKAVTEWKDVREDDVRKHVDTAYEYYFESEIEEE